MPNARPLVPSARSRQRVLVALVLVAVATLVVALVASQPGTWGLQVVADVLLAGYLVMLIHARNTSAALEMSRGVLDR